MSLERISTVFFKFIFFLYVSADLVKLQGMKYILKEKIAAII